jgi:hypothetical protein
MTKIKNWGGIDLSAGIALDEPRQATRQIVESPLPQVDFGNVQVSGPGGTSLRKRKKESFASDETPEPNSRKRSVQISQPERTLNVDLKGFNFNSMSKSTKDLVVKLHSSRPTFMVPEPTSQKTLPGAVLKAFGGDVKWFKSPPLDRVESGGLSRVYLKYLADKVRKDSKSGPKVVPVDAEMDVDETEPEQVIPSTESLMQVLRGKNSKFNCRIRKEKYE